MLRLKRVYDSPKQTDGVRILVDRLWPRGLTRQEARIDRWIRSISPSTELRKWFHEHPRRWVEFKKKYKDELDTPAKRKVLDEIRGLANGRAATLLYASKNEKRNNAIALAEILKNS